MTDGTPNVEELPRPSLDINVVQFLGRNKRWKVEVAIQNLIGAYNQQIQQYKGQTYYHQLYQTGQEFYIGLSYLIQ